MPMKYALEFHRVSLRGVLAGKMNSSVSFMVTCLRITRLGQNEYT